MNRDLPTTVEGAPGIDPAQAPIPVAPAAHYHMGGIAVDARGRSSLRGLWAAGEVSAVHQNLSEIARIFSVVVPFGTVDLLIDLESALGLALGAGEVSAVPQNQTQ